MGPEHSTRRVRIHSNFKPSVHGVFPNRPKPKILNIQILAHHERRAGIPAPSGAEIRLHEDPSRHRYAIHVDEQPVAIHQILNPPAMFDTAPNIDAGADPLG